MMLRLAIRSPGLLLAVSLSVAGAATGVLRAAVAADAEGPFLALNETAMNKMMAGMAAKPMRDADRDFVAMMEPHHQGAVDMSQAELQYGQNPVLKAIAQEIIVDQMQEITLMRLALGEPLPRSVPSPTQASSSAMQTAPANESHANQTPMHLAPGMQMPPGGPFGAHRP